MKNILIVHKAAHEAAATLADKIAAWLTGMGYDVCAAASGQQIAGAFPDLVIVLGGDGTILGIARQVAGEQIPILGINFGRLGILTATDESGWYSAILRTIQGDLPVSQCMALLWKLKRDGKVLNKGVAVNDAVIGRGALARLGCFTVCIDERALGTVRSDGVIISTPIGSTGYGSSAGGPILEKSLNIMSVSTICPFLKHIPPLVIPGYSRVELKLAHGSRDCTLTIDGQDGYALIPEDTIELTGMPKAICLLGCPDILVPGLHELEYKFD